MSKKDNHMENEKIIYRQGDIAFIKVDAPTDSEATPLEREDGRIIVALGEVTGHSHSIVTETAQMHRDAALDMEWLVAPDETEVLHQEHAPLNLPAGNYLIVRQREYKRGKLYKVYD